IRKAARRGAAYPRRHPVPRPGARPSSPGGRGVTMRAVLLRRPGPPQSLRLEDAPEPVARAGEVLLQNKAAGVNFADVLARQGLYPDAPERPFIPGYESSGEVLALGEGVNGLRV